MRRCFSKRKFKLLFAFSVLISICSCRTPIWSNAIGKDIFATSRRRVATDAEAGYVARIEACTGFFLKSTSGKTVVMTARHCFEHSIKVAKEFCATPPYNTITDNLGKTFTCKELVAGDETSHDVFVFEFVEPRDGPSLRLAAFSPTINMRLQLLGYPGDKLNTDRSSAWSSENCVVKEIDVESYFKNSGKNSKDVSFRHDCSTYGGNSGGPMIIEGTDVAVGMPSRYTTRLFNQDGTFNWRDQDYSFGIALWDFATAHRARLASVGVELLNAEPTSRVDAGYFLSGQFKGLGANSQECLEVIPRYMLTRTVQSLIVRYCGEETKRSYSCKKEDEVVVCNSYDKAGAIVNLRIVDLNTLKLVRSSGETVFKRQKVSE